MERGEPGAHLWLLLLGEKGQIGPGSVWSKVTAACNTFAEKRNGKKLKWKEMVIAESQRNVSIPQACKNENRKITSKNPSVHK